jgi:hypothetical protein
LHISQAVALNICFRRHLGLSRNFLFLPWQQFFIFF